MNETFNIMLEDDDGKVILPADSQKGNAFAVRFLPRKGDEIQVNDASYIVIGVIHELSPEFLPNISLRVRLKSLNPTDEDEQ
jgi:hypothetical protein